MDESVLRDRIAALRQQWEDRSAPLEAVYPGTLTVAIALYGADSHQVRELRAAGPEALKFARSAIDLPALTGPGSELAYAAL